MASDNHAVITQMELKSIAAALGPLLRPVIQSAVDIAFQAGRERERQEPKDAYKETEKRLYALSTLRDAIEHKRYQIEAYQNRDVSGRSKSLVRFQRTDSRMSLDDIADVMIQNLTAEIAANQNEIDLLEKALATIHEDPYYRTVYGKFIKGTSDEDIAAEIPCDPSTVRRNRGRLVRKIAVWLYGTAAI